MRYVQSVFYKEYMDLNQPGTDFHIIRGYCLFPRSFSLKHEVGWYKEIIFVSAVLSV